MFTDPERPNFDIMEAQLSAFNDHLRQKVLLKLVINHAAQIPFSRLLKILDCAGKDGPYRDMPLQQAVGQGIGRTTNLRLIKKFVRLVGSSAALDY